MVNWLRDLWFSVVVRGTPQWYGAIHDDDHVAFCTLAWWRPASVRRFPRAIYLDGHSERIRDVMVCEGCNASVSVDDHLEVG